MSADLLRQAASLIRARAEAATPGPWVVVGDDDELLAPRTVTDSGEPGERYIVAEYAGSDAEHIASFASPAVALAVADWLETAAQDHELRFQHAMCDERALDVARAYLSP